MNAKELFWLNLERYRKLRNLTFDELARRTNQTPSALHRLRNRKSNIGIESLDKYAKALDVKVIDLLEIWTDDEWHSYFSANQEGVNN